MSARWVLDSYSVILFLEREAGWEKVARLLRLGRDAGHPLLLCVVNWGEVYYISVRKAGEEAARRAMQVVDGLPIEIVPADRALTRAAAEIKATHKMSYADAFAAALAEARKATLVTGDREFKEIEGRVKIEWL